MSFSIQCGTSTVIKTSLTEETTTFSPISYPANWATMTPEAQQAWLEKTAKDSLYLTNEGDTFFKQCVEAVLEDIKRRATCGTCPQTGEKCALTVELVSPDGGQIATLSIGDITIISHMQVTRADGVTGISITFRVTFGAFVKATCASCENH